jgi:hypothetical protein
MSVPAVAADSPRAGHRLRPVRPPPQAQALVPIAAAVVPCRGGLTAATGAGPGNLDPSAIRGRRNLEASSRRWVNSDVVLNRSMFFNLRAFRPLHLLTHRPENQTGITVDAIAHAFKVLAYFLRASLNMRFTERFGNDWLLTIQMSGDYYQVLPRNKVVATKFRRISQLETQRHEPDQPVVNTRESPAKAPRNLN